MKLKHATSYDRLLAGLLLTLSFIILIGCEETKSMERMSGEIDMPIGISTDTNTTPTDISALAARMFHKTEQFEINQVMRTSVRSEYEQMIKQLMDNEATASNGDSVGLSGDATCGESNSIPGSVKVIARSDNRLYCLVHNDSNNTISLLTNDGTELWNKCISLTLAYVSNSGNVVIARHQQYQPLMPIIEHLYFIGRSGNVKREILPISEYRLEGRSWMFCASGNAFVFSAYPRLIAGPNGVGVATKPTLIFVYDFNSDEYTKYEAEGERIDDLYVSSDRYVCFYNYDTADNTIFNVLDAENNECDTIQLADSTVICPYQVRINGSHIFVERSRYWENKGLALFEIYAISRMDGN